MSRLITVDLVGDAIPDEVVVAVGDVLRFDASGGRVREGDAVEIVGIFTDGILGTDGQALSPMGPPNAVMFRARQPGTAEIDVVTGDPWHSPSTRSLTVVVQG